MGLSSGVFFSYENFSEKLQPIIKALPLTALNDALRCARLGGRVHLLGLPKGAVPIDFSSDVIFKGLTLKGIYGREILETWYKMTSMLQSGLDVQPLLTHGFRFEDFQKGFDIMRSGQSGKVVLDWT